MTIALQPHARYITTTSLKWFSWVSFKGRSNGGCVASPAFKTRWTSRLLVFLLVAALTNHDIREILHQTRCSFLVRAFCESEHCYAHGPPLVTG